MTAFAPRFVEEGTFLNATVGQSGFLALRLDGKSVTRLPAGKVTIAVADKSSKDNFHLKGAGVDRSTSVVKKRLGRGYHVEEGRLPLLVQRKLEEGGPVRVVWRFQNRLLGRRCVRRSPGYLSVATERRIEGGWT